MAKRRAPGEGSVYQRKPGGAWYLSWRDHRGKRHEMSSRTVDKQTANRMLSKRRDEIALRRDGIVNEDKHGFGVEGRRPLAEHVADYLEYCVQVDQAAKNIEEKRRHLARLIAMTDATRISDLTAERLQRCMARLRDSGLSARTANFARQAAVAFMSWALKVGRVESNRLRVVPKYDESRDRRRIRRPLTEDELSRLLAVAQDRGRRAWYLAAALAGLQRGDLRSHRVA